MPQRTSILLAVAGLMLTSAWPVQRLCVLPLGPAATQRRHVLATSLGLGAGIAQGMNAPARAELPRLLVRSLKRYAQPLQHAADELVFEVKPAIQSGNWTKVSKFFVGAAYSKSNAD